MPGCKADRRQREGLGYRRTAKPPLGRSLDERRRQRMTLAPTFGDRRIDGPIVGIDAPDAGVVSPTARHGRRNGPASAHEPGASADTQAVAKPAFGQTSTRSARPARRPQDRPRTRRVPLRRRVRKYREARRPTPSRTRAPPGEPSSRPNAPPPSQDRPDRPRQAESDCGYGRNRAVHSVRKKNGNGTRPPMNRRMRPIVR